MRRVFESEDTRISKHFVHGKLITADHLLSRLIQHRDENPIAVDYDVDSDDDDFLEKINDGGAEELSVNEMEQAMHALEVESFELLLHHVEVRFLSLALTPSLSHTHPPSFSRTEKNWAHY